jgi:hypothetical protein
LGFSLRDRFECAIIFGLANFASAASNPTLRKSPFDFAQGRLLVGTVLLVDQDSRKDGCPRYSFYLIAHRGHKWPLFHGADAAALLARSRLKGAVPRLNSTSTNLYYFK